MSRAIVLTGGIGSGKSHVAGLLAGWGALVVDADDLARQVVAPGSEGLRAVVAEFGQQVVARDGSLDRAALADIVFADAPRLARLEAIVHPLVEALAAERLAAAGSAPVLVYEVPLPGRSAPFPPEALEEGRPLVVVVDAPVDVRRSRLSARGLPPDQIRLRMQAQPARSEWLARGDVVIDNSGARSATRRQVADLWRRLTRSDPPVGGGG